MSLKKTVLYVSGITNKQAEEYQQVNDFMTYILKEDLNSFHSNYAPEERERYKENLNLFVEIDNHIFPISSVRQIYQLKQYNSTQLLEMLVDDFNKKVSENRVISLGLAQYLNRVDDYNKVQEYRKQVEINKQLERQRIQDEKEQQRQVELNSTLDKAENKLLQGEKIEGETFVLLCDRYNIKLPLRTRGWALNSLDMINGETYSYYGNPSTVIMDYVKVLIDKLQPETEQEQEDDLDDDMIKQLFTVGGTSF